MNTDLPTLRQKLASRLTRLRRHPLSLIIVQMGLFFGLLVALKSLLIKPGLSLLGFEGDIFRSLQGITTLIAMFAIYAGLARFYEKRSLQELAPGYMIRDGLQGTLLGFVMISIVFAVLSVAGAFHIIGSGSVSAMIAPVIWVILMATMEELLFRGILYRILEGWLGTLLALVLSATLFGLMHLPNENADAISVISATSGGLLMCALYSLKGRLWIPIFFHASWNFTQAIYGSAVSGAEIFGTYFESVREGPEWLTGGPFGIENSYLAIGLVLSVLAVTLVQMARRGLFLRRGVSRSS